MATSVPFFRGLFGPSAGQPAASGAQNPPQQQPQGQPPQQQQMPTPGSSMQPGGGQQGEQAQASPMDQWKDLWKTPANNDAAGTDPFAAPLFQSDPSKLNEAISQTDFMQSVPQELMQKAMSGQDPQAFMQVVNAAMQQGLRLQLQLSTSLIEQGGQTMGKRMKEFVPKEFGQLQDRSQTPTNPLLSNPAVQPMLEMARKQIRMNNPDKSAQEVNAMAERYLTDFAGTLAPGKAGSGEASGEKEQDWLSWTSRGN